MKSKIRSAYKAKRQVLSKNERLDLEAKIHELLFNHFDFKQQFIHTFLPIEKQMEVNTTKVNNTFYKLDCQLATSITLYNPLSLTHSIIPPNTTYVLDKYNIPTPTQKIDFEINQLNFVIVPLLAFDRLGNRVGYGKGLYDSFLTHCNTDCIKIGLSYFDVHPTAIATEQHDVKLDFCVTPNKLYSF